MASYAKLRDGTWGIRTTNEPAVGEDVEVVTKSGKTKTETVAKIIWHGIGYDGNPSWLCAIETKDDNQL